MFPFKYRSFIDLMPDWPHGFRNNVTKNGNVITSYWNYITLSTPILIVSPRGDLRRTRIQLPYHQLIHTTKTFSPTDLSILRWHRRVQRITTSSSLATPPPQIRSLNLYLRVTACPAAIIAVNIVALSCTYSVLFRGMTILNTHTYYESPVRRLSSTIMSSTPLR